MSDLISLYDTACENIFYSEYDDWYKQFYLASVLININSSKGKKVKPDQLVPEEMKKKKKELEAKRNKKLTQEDKQEIMDNIKNSSG